ncbi:MAG: flavodoxin-dependent (E)-4-hydroxy-3-methylbut-2-enyl-diphosphate synthase [Oscillospiraceae bacterium]|nr:flavodoxin-dependent (E)-4-hydroxy-3-methylbut-2-enyl-diphosphate synthase [Oscillospiraceae bacterium]
MQRRITRAVRAGTLVIGGGARISVQSMLNCPVNDIPANVAQANALQAAGCDIVRIAVPDKSAARTIAALKEQCGIPVVADIHFDHKLALESLAAGADKIRLNPGNIGGQANVQAVANACAQHNVPIRIGVNGGSLEKEFLEKHGSATAEAMAESALNHARLLEQCDFQDIVISVKSSHVQRTVQAYQLLAEACDYPLHIGLTEAGTAKMGLVKSNIAIGALLLQGIGDTIRVSLTANPVEEIAAAQDILHALGQQQGRPNIVSCPTCGRCKIDLIALASAAEERLASCSKNITVAIMGCVVNGPGEAREADVGLAGGDGCYALFARGEVLRRVSEENALDALMEAIEAL